MWTNLPLRLSLAAVAVLCMPSAATAEDELFSDVEINSVFSTKPASEDANRFDSSKSARVRSVEHLGRLLRIEGFGFERVGSRTYAATTSLKDWSFPTLVTLSENRERIGFILGLVQYEETTNLSREKMLQMLVANQAVAPYQFSFNEDRKRTELVLVIDNRDVNSGRLSKVITELKEVARGSLKTWNDDKSNGNTSGNASNPVVKNGSSQDTKNPPQTVAPKPTLVTAAAVVGRWQFAKSATEAFALSLTADQKFTLVQVANGNPITSTGTFSITDGDMTLNVPNGLTLVGPIEMASTDQFRFTPKSSSKPLVFDRVK